MLALLCGLRGPYAFEIEAKSDLESRPRVAAQLLSDIARGRPLLFWADDAHWSPGRTYTETDEFFGVQV